MQNIKPVQKCAKYEMKPVQYAQVSYFADFSRLYINCNFEINGNFNFYLFIYFFIFFFWGGGGGGCGGGDFGRFYGIESFHIIYFYFH